MTAFIKILLLEPTNAKLRGDVTGLFDRHQKYMDVELQQRATEYLVRLSHTARVTVSGAAWSHHVQCVLSRWGRGWGLGGVLPCLGPRSRLQAAAAPTTAKCWRPCA